MNARDWASLIVGLLGCSGWFFGWWKHREFKAEQRELRAELRGVRGYKFRLMYRTLAKEYGWPLNGEDEN